MPNEPSRHSDNELFYQLRRGGRQSERAFEELYDRLSARVFKYCRRVLGNQALAEDVFQETFTKFFQSARQERTMTNVAAFILRIARNLCLNAKESKYYGLAPLEEFQLPSTEFSYENRELMEILKSAVECLPLEYKEAFVLREYDGLAYNEIAAVLDISVSTVKIRIYRAKDRIRKILAPYVADINT